MSLSLIIVYLIAATSLSIIPGPTMLLALSNGTSKNNITVLMGIIGTGLGNLILITAVSFGLGAMMQASSTLFNFVKWFGTLYLIWLAIGLWRHNPDMTKLQMDSNKTIYRAFVRSLVVALSNPKGLLFLPLSYLSSLINDNPNFYNIVF